MERGLLKMLAAAAAAAALAASGFAVSAAAQTDQQPAAAEQPTHAEQVQHWAEVGIDNQLKGLKTSLRLTADQEKDWGTFESAVKDAQKARVVALQKEQATNLSPMDRNTAKAERLEQSQADLEKVTEAAKPLYVSLDGAQRQKFIALGRMLVPERGQFAKEIRRLGLGKAD
jgi:LTXXQ motif family protein